MTHLDKQVNFIHSEVKETVTLPLTCVRIYIAIGIYNAANIFQTVRHSSAGGELKLTAREKHQNALD